MGALLERWEDAFGNDFRKDGECFKVLEIVSAKLGSVMDLLFSFYILSNSQL